MMNGVFRLFRVVAALVVAIVMAGLTLFFLSPLAGDALIGGFRHFFDALFASDDPEALVDATVLGMAWLLMLLTVAPVVVIGLIGELARWRSALWYVAGTALLTAAIPWLMRGTWTAPAPGEARISAYLAVVGLVSGTIYWLIAGSRAAANPNNEGALS